MRAWTNAVGVMGVMAVLLMSCTASYQVGKIACDNDSQCPSGWQCAPRRSDHQRRCYPGNVDAATFDSGGGDGGLGVDAGGCGRVCDDSIYCNGSERCDLTNPNADSDGCVTTPRDCDDQILCTADSCDETQQRCLHIAPDNDQDAHEDAACVDGDGNSLGDDCDDNDNNRYPGNTETCVPDEPSATHDEDCNPLTFGNKDSDGDGSIDNRCCNPDSNAPNGMRCGGDCNDNDIAMRTGQPEFCDNKDNDCDDVIDNNTVAIAWYLDADSDLFGSALDTSPVMSCTTIVGASPLNTDCDDTAIAVNPANSEICDAIDNNCNQMINEGLTCTDIDECLAGILVACGTGATGCNDTTTSHECVCDDGYEGTGTTACTPCPSGFTGDGATCTDIDECLTNNGGCSATPMVTCTNTPGSRTCAACPSGYAGTGIGNCTDINECLTNNGGCSVTPMVACMNNAGSRSCGACPTGYTGTGIGSCTDVNECLTNNGGCDTNPMAACANTVGSRTCSCDSPTMGDGVGPYGCAAFQRGPAPTVSSASAAGSYVVATYTDGFRDGPDFGAATIYYPTDAEPPFAIVAICPGYTAPQSTVAVWGPFLASHGIVAMTIDANSTSAWAPARAAALWDAIVSLRAENVRSGSPLEGNVAVDRVGVMGWSTGGGATWFAGAERSELRTAISLNGTATNDVPDPSTTVAATLLLAGSADTATFGGGKSQPIYEAIPTSTPKMLYEFAGADHYSADNPADRSGAVGRYVLSWEKVFLEYDERYRQFLIAPVTDASDFRSNLQ